MTKESLIEQLTERRQELIKALRKTDSLKIEIDRLEDLLNRKAESLNNHNACFNPIEFAQRNCKECGFYERCSFHGKEDYGRFKL